MAAKELGIQEHVIRFWETQFPNIITPTIGAGSRRYYYDRDIEILLKIKKYLYEDGYTIKGLQNLLSRNSIFNEDRNDNFTKKLEYKEKNNIEPDKFDYYSKIKNNTTNNRIENRAMNDDLFNNVEEERDFNVFNNVKERKNEISNNIFYKNNNKKNAMNIKDMLISFNDRLMEFSMKLESL